MYFWFFLQIAYVVVDEAHSVSSWGKSQFREDFQKLIILRCVLWNAKLVSLRTTAYLTPPTRAHHVTQIAESGLHMKLGAFRHPLESLVSR